MSKRRRVEPRVLLVEGKDEQRLLPELLELGGIEWPDNKPPIWIEEKDGVEKVLEHGSIEAELQASELQSLGIVVDANGDPEARWTRIRELLVSFLPDFPQANQPAGVIHEGDDGRRVGVWLMPDNIRTGMLETLLLAIRGGHSAVAGHARVACDEAKRLGAPFREPHRDKAELHTWLAWQDPPGQQMHLAMRMKMLPIDGTIAAPFVKWGKDLHRL
jgi:hypothetical protein